MTAKELKKEIREWAELLLQGRPDLATVKAREIDAAIDVMAADVMAADAIRVAMGWDAQPAKDGDR